MSGPLCGVRFYGGCRGLTLPSKTWRLYLRCDWSDCGGPSLKNRHVPPKHCIRRSCTWDHWSSSWDFMSTYSYRTHLIWWKSATSTLPRILLPGSMTITRGELLMETGLRQVLLDVRQSWLLQVCHKSWPLLTWSYTCALSLAASTSSMEFAILPGDTYPVSMKSV
jgi:hypothetical protein